MRRYIVNGYGWFRICATCFRETLRFHSQFSEKRRLSAISVKSWYLFFAPRKWNVRYNNVFSMCKWCWKQKRLKTVWKKMYLQTSWKKLLEPSNSNFHGDDPDNRVEYYELTLYKICTCKYARLTFAGKAKTTKPIAVLVFTFFALRLLRRAIRYVQKGCTLSVMGMVHTLTTAAASAPEAWTNVIFRQAGLAIAVSWFYARFLLVMLCRC